MAHEPPRVAAHFVCHRQDWRGTGPNNTRFRTVDVEYVLRQSDTRMLITTDYSGPIVS